MHGFVNVNSAFVDLSDFRAHEDIYNTSKRNMSVCLSETFSDLRIVRRSFIKICDTS